MPPELRVYVKPGCPWCVQAVAFLRDAGFDFEEIDVTSDRERFAEMENPIRPDLRPDDADERRTKGRKLFSQILMWTN